MGGKEINISTDLEKYFKQFVSILNPVVFKLRNAELSLYSLLLYEYTIRDGIERGERMKLIFDYDNRIKMMDKLGMSGPVFANTLTSLRKKGVLSGRAIADKYIFSPEGNSVITIKFNINGEDNRRVGKEVSETKRGN